MLVNSDTSKDAVMRYHKVPDETVGRMPVYLRAVSHLSNQGQESISSKTLAEFVGINPWQIRKDFSYFGDFGTPGKGYNTEKLLKQLSRILRLNSGHRVVLVGVGNIGRAVLAYPDFRRYGFEIVAAFDSDAGKIGKKVSGVIIEDVAELASAKERDVDMAIIAAPPDVAQAVADALVEAGIRGILNFAPRHIAVPKKVKVITIDIAMDLARLPYYMPAVSGGQAAQAVE
jgi:redox-sensing transcriptional repressor